MGVDFVAVLDQVIALLRQRGRVGLPDPQSAVSPRRRMPWKALKDELLYAQQIARDEEGRRVGVDGEC